MNILQSNWLEVKDGDPRAVGIFKRHYSANPKTDNVRYGFSGKGESMVLMDVSCRTIFCWRKVEGEGINCSVFRNESTLLSSELIKEADELAWQKWDDKRHYTYVDSKKIRSTHPGYCFILAGWNYMRDENGKPILTKKNKLYILEIFKVASQWGCTEAQG